MKSNILVLGGTGKTGRKVVEKLNQLNHNVRIGSRSATPSFDWNTPENWSTALTGIERVYITFQPDLAVPGALQAIERLVEESKKAGVQKLVLLSGKGEREAELCEQVVINSGINHTIIRASWFSQNFSESFLLDPIKAGFVALPKAEARVPYVDTGDIADMAVEVLLNDSHNSKIYQLTGPKTYTFPEIVEEISYLTGRDIKFQSISVSEYVEGLKSVGIPEDYVWLIDYLFTNVLDAEGNNQISDDIENVLGRPAKSFSQYAIETVATGIWDSTKNAAVEA